MDHPRATRFASALLWFSGLFAFGQTPAVTLPAGTPLAVQIPEHLPMHVGEPIWQKRRRSQRRRLRWKPDRAYWQFSPIGCAGIGAYGTAVAVYRRWIARCHNVSFVRDTRIVLEATPRSATVLK